MLASERDRPRDNVAVLGDGQILKVQPSRQRKIFSCVYCHLKKIKCSREQPVCNNCVKVGVSCKYFINERVSRGGRKRKSDSGLAPAKRDPAPQTKPELSEPAGPAAPSSDSLSHPQLFQGQPPELTPEPSAFISPPHTSLLLESLGRPRDLGTPGTGSEGPLAQLPAHILTPALTQALGQALGQSLAHTLSQNFNESWSESLSPYTYDQKLFRKPHGSSAFYAEGITRQDWGGGRNSSSRSDSNSLGTSGTFEPIAKSEKSSSSAPEASINGALGVAPTSPVDSVNPTISNSLNPFPSNPATTVNYLYGTNINYGNTNLLMDLSAHLTNTRERSYELVERYENSVHALLPILVNIEEFKKQHDLFWSIQASPGHDDFDHLQFYVLYFPVMYAATIPEFEEYDNLLLNEDIDRYLKAFNKICQHYNYPHGLKTIPLLLGNTIIQCTLPNPLTMEMSQIIRYAKFLQFHKDPEITLRITDSKVVKFRRMLWWVIFGLDALSSHNFCLPPVCRFNDFNVRMPDIYDQVAEHEDKFELNISLLAMLIKFHFDRILSDLVNHLHNGFLQDILPREIDAVKRLIVDLFHYIHALVAQLNEYQQKHPVQSVQDLNVLNFLKNHSWSFVDRAVMLLHKKILLTGSKSIDEEPGPGKLVLWTRSSGALALSEFEDTFGRSQEANIIGNFDQSSLAQLRFDGKVFSYEDLHNNLIPSILHNLNDFLKYNDFIKYGKFNWYIKRTIPLDLIILLLVVICVKFKYDYMTVQELVVYVKLINKTLFIFNKKYFKNEKYKRMLSLTNLTWEYILKQYDVVPRIAALIGQQRCAVEFIDHQAMGAANTSELFSVMDVPRPTLMKDGIEYIPFRDQAEQVAEPLPVLDVQSKRWVPDPNKATELVHLKQKIYYDLRNNFVDINDYCTFYSLLENVLRELMDYIQGLEKWLDR